jgi:hypothetical protein
MYTKQKIQIQAEILTNLQAATSTSKRLVTNNTIHLKNIYNMKALKITFLLALLVTVFTSCTEQDLNDDSLLAGDQTENTDTGGDIDEFTGGDIDE